MNTIDLIDNIQAGDAQTSNNAFNDIMADKMVAALNDRKQEVASSMYGVQDTPIEEPTNDENI